MGTIIQARDHYESHHKPATCGHGQVVVDLESLILDATPGIQDSLIFTARSLALNVSDEELSQVVGGEPISALLFRWIGEPQATRQALQVYQEHFDAHGRFLSCLRPGADAVLDAIASVDWPVHYLTHIGKDAAFRLLKAYAAQSGIHSIISTQGSGSGLMRPHLLSGLLRDRAVGASETLLVTDHPLELSAAADLGVPAMALAYGRSPPAMLLHYRPAALARHCRDAASLLRLHCMQRVGSAIN